MASLTPCRLVDLIDVTQACEDANSKLFEVVTVADVDVGVNELGKVKLVLRANKQCWRASFLAKTNWQLQQYSAIKSNFNTNCFHVSIFAQEKDRDCLSLSEVLIPLFLGSYPIIYH